MTDMLEMMRTLGDQLRWAVDIELDSIPAADEILLAGMGGSGVAGDYLAAAIGEGRARVSVHKGYAPLPGWAPRVRPLVIGASYSGNTEETVDMVTHAADSGLSVATVTTGGELGRLTEEKGWPGLIVPKGLQPRAALGYMAGAAMRIANASGAAADPRSALAESGELADAALSEGSAAWKAALDISGALQGRIAIVYGGGPISDTVAGRWKTQINENAKMPSWSSVLPELDHNELVGWETMPSTTQDLLGIVSLSDRSDHPRVDARRRHSEALTAPAVPWVGHVESWGDSALARLISLTTVGDLTSWMMARQAGVDPELVITIEKLKELLKED